MTPAPTQARRGGDTDRRRRILEATLVVLGRDGPGALTHRAVAAEADVPLAATTYYFASKDELLREALELLVALEAERLAEQRDRLGAALADPEVAARAIADVLAAQAAIAVKFELYLAAARVPALRDDARRYIGTFVELATHLTGDRGAAELLVASIDGLVLHALATDGRVDPDALAARVGRLLDR